MTTCGSGCPSAPAGSVGPRDRRCWPTSPPSGARPRTEPSALAVPVLTGYGSESKPYHQEAARKLAEWAPDGELIVVEGSGHACQSSHPQEFAAFVRRAVERASSGQA